MKTIYNTFVKMESQAERIIEQFIFDQEEKTIDFTEWLIKKCDFQKHGVWLYKGMEMTPKELLDVFKHDIS